MKPTTVTLYMLCLHCRVKAMAIQEERLQRVREAGELAREVREQKLADQRAEQVLSLQVHILHTHLNIDYTKLDAIFTEFCLKNNRNLVIYPIPPLKNAKNKGKCRYPS